MGNPRCPDPFQFENLGPPWDLAQLDTNNVNQTNAINDSSMGASNFVSLDTGTVNSYAIASTQGVSSAYNVGMQYTFIPSNSNTGPAVINVDGLGSKAIVLPDTNPLFGYELIGGVSITLQFDGTNMRILAMPRWPVSKQFGTVAGSLILQCLGGASIGATWTVTASVNVSISLNQLSYAVPIFLAAANASTGVRTSPIFVSDPNGVGGTVIYQSSSTHGSIPPNVPNGSYCLYSGMLMPGPILLIRATIG